MSRTPNTPFIPPLPTTPGGSPGHTPVIPTSAPNSNPTAGGPGYTPYSYSPYSNHSPFVPDLSPMVTPGVVPGPFSPQQQPKVNRHGFSEDFTGYPQGPAFAPPLLTPMSAYNPYSPYTGSHANSPHYPASAPATYQGFNTTPWNSNTAQLPPTPWGGPPRLPPQGYAQPFGNYGPPPPPMGPPPHFQPPMGGNIPPPQAMNGPPPHMMNGQGHQGWPGASTPFYGGADPGPWMGQQPHLGQQPHFAQQPFRVPPEPPAQIFDRFDPFTEGTAYGAVLDPFLVQVVHANVRLNPLITPLPYDGPDHVYLNWNMLFPTSSILRSTDPTHVSWSKGRDAPATFPRISSLQLVSETIPWVLNVKARDNSVGITCGEVIDSIGHQLNKFSNKQDYDRLPHNARREVSHAYRHNRSRENGVPGGQLGAGMKWLDFLRQDTMFAGIDIDERVVKSICGEVLPCVFVLKCSKTLPSTRQEAEDREARLRAEKAPSRPRSRATSSTTRITVRPPTTTGSDDDDLHS